MEDMSDDGSVRAWAQNTFGRARLGDSRRVARLVAMAATAAKRPGGKITQVFKTSAEREASFRLLENTAVKSQHVRDAVFDATARDVDGSGLVFVAVDCSTLTFTDNLETRELGRVGSRFFTRGLHVMSALAVEQHGAVKGLLEQRWWARGPLVRNKPKRQDPKKSEIRHWLDAISLSEKRIRAEATDTRAWYQLDRGGDAWPMLNLARQHRLLMTIRSRCDRNILHKNGTRGLLYRALRSQEVLGHFDVDVPPRNDRPARVARIAIRTYRAHLTGQRRRYRRKDVVVNAVLAEEVGHAGEDAIQWTLLTTAPVQTLEQARLVVGGYSTRWRIEDLHRAWKNGLCRVEDSQLRRLETLLKWVTILAAVAARALTLTKLARTQPELPAAEQFTNYEIDAAFLLLKRKRDPKQMVTLREMIALVAELGGFANKYSKTYPHPGPTVLGRGLDRVETLAEGLKNLAEM